MWRRGLLYTLLAATVAATATDGETTPGFLVKNTPFDTTTCEHALHPSTLDIDGLKLQAQRFSSCACEMAYSLAIFVVALYCVLNAEKLGKDTTAHYERLLRWLSVFNTHYSRDLSISRFPLSLLSGLQSLTSLRSINGKKLARRPACDLVARQEEANRSFCMRRYWNDRRMNRYAYDVLTFSETARRWLSFSSLTYNIHNGSGGGGGVFPVGANVVAQFALAANSGGSNAGHHVLAHGNLPNGPPLHIFGGGTLKPAVQVFDIDLHAIDDAADEADDAADDDALMADASAPAALAVVPFGGAFTPAASALDTFPAPHVTFVVAPPPLRIFGARGAADDVLDARFFLDKEDCDEQPSAATASARPALHHLRALLRASTSTARHAAVDGFGASAAPSLGSRVAQLLAAEAPRRVVVLDTCGVAAGCLFTDTLDASSVRGTVLDTYLARPTAQKLAADTRTAVSLLDLGAKLDQASRAYDASGAGPPLYLHAGTRSVSTKTDSPVDAVAADGSTDAVDSNGAAVSTTTTPAAQSDLDPALKTRYKNILATVKGYRDNGYDGSNLLGDLSELVRGLKTPDGDPMHNKSEYMTERHWAPAPGRKKAKSKQLRGEPFRDALIKELEVFLGLEPSTVEALDDDDDEAEEAVPDTSVKETSRLLRNVGLCTPTMPNLKTLCKNFEVDITGLNCRQKIKRKLIARFEEILEDADDAYGGVDAKAAMAAITAGAKGSGVDADEDEFWRVLVHAVGESKSLPVLDNSFASRIFVALLPPPALEAPSPQKKLCVSAPAIPWDLWMKLVAFLPLASLDLIAQTSRAAHAIVPVRTASSVMSRRLSGVNGDTDPASYQTVLLDEFLAVDPRAPKATVIASCRAVARRLFLKAGSTTAIEDAVGRGTTPEKIVRSAAKSLRYAALELEQLCLPTSQRNVWFEDWANVNVACTENVNVKLALVGKLVELRVDKVLRGETEHDLDKVVSTSKEDITLRTSLGSWRGGSKAERARFMKGKGRFKHATTEAIDIIKEASSSIETSIVELTKDYPGQFDKAVEFFLDEPDFAPKDDAEAAAVAGWRSWRQDPRHLAYIEQETTGEDN